MKRLQMLVAVILLSSFGNLVLASDRWETLRAINMVENPTNQTGYGPKGELGPYQFRSSTWSMYTTKPFRMANDRALADQVAVLHYEWLKERLKAAGIDDNVYNIALAWNCGISAVIKGRIPMETYHYAERVNNLAGVYHQPQNEESSLQVVTTAKSTPQIAGIQFTRVDRNDAPEFKIATQSFYFRVAGETPRFALTPAKSRFVFVLN